MSKDTRKDERKSCLKWLREKDPDLGETINMIGSSGSTALALAGQFDWKGETEEKDQVIRFSRICGSPFSKYHAEIIKISVFLYKLVSQR